MRLCWRETGERVLGRPGLLISKVCVGDVPARPHCFGKKKKERVSLAESLQVVKEATGGAKSRANIYIPLDLKETILQSVIKPCGISVQESKKNSSGN